jgi:cytochrome c oxidase assembly factor CtaG
MASLEWNLAPSIIIGTALLLAAYLGAIGPFRKYIPTSKPVKPREFIQFILGILILFLALTSPLDAMSDDYLFSAHMIQHSLLTLAAPPLILAGIPGWLAAYIVRNPSINKAARIVTNPVLAFVLYNLVYSLWHLPVAYEAALENENIHIVEHLSFIVTAVLFWWPILSSTTTLPGLSYARQILYLFLATIPCTVLGGVFVFAPGIIYAKYSSAPQLFPGIVPMTDQQIAGVIMAMAGMLVYLGFLGRAFYIWYTVESRQTVHSE